MLTSRPHVISVLLAVVSGFPTNPGDPIFHALNHSHPSRIWAVLGAGSSGWYEYGMQASICHAYQIFHAHGVPDEQIIVMMYDDLAYNEDNPNQGVVINKPGGPNVYKNVLKDYTGYDVTAENVLNVITGNKSAMEGIGSGKVLQSGPNDYVFINFVGYGDVGVIYFPLDLLYVETLSDAFNTMHQNNMYKQLLVYLDTSKSGSMFGGFLPSNMNILAVSSSLRNEDTHFTYYDRDMRVFVGLLFSVAWMEDIDSEEHHKNLTTETLLHQYKNVVRRVGSVETPQVFGTKSILKSRIIRFFGKDIKKTAQSFENNSPIDIQDSVKSTDVHISTLERRILESQNGRERQMLRNKLDILLKGRAAFDNLLNNIMAQLSSERSVAIVEERLPLTMATFGCYKTLVDAFNRQCVNITSSPYVLQHLYKLANICAAGDISTADVLRAFTAECTSHATVLNIY